MQHLLVLENAFSLALAYASDPDPAGAIIGIIILLVLMVIGSLFYFLPAIIAIFRSHQNWGAIAIVNLFFGWTLVGWVIALAWSVTGQGNN